MPTRLNIYPMRHESPTPPPWKKKRPKSAKATKLTPEQIAEARARAAAAGRPYPNLIDNMAVAREAKKRAELGLDEE